MSNMLLTHSGLLGLVLWAMTGVLCFMLLVFDAEIPLTIILGGFILSAVAQWEYNKEAHQEQAIRTEDAS